MGLTVNAWTVNKVEDMKWLMEMKADFITTDEPELLFTLLD
ncbi:glycerophosphodiester phosphodiesterase family protein [Algoriphagus boritolerans]